MNSRLVIDTNATSPFSSGFYGITGPSPATPSSSFLKKRDRSFSNASTSSSLSVISPNTSSTNASATSLLIPAPRHYSPSPSRSRSASPNVDETIRLGPEYVLAMHDYTPQSGNATCLAFRAGQIIQVHNRDTSGWWDGELEGRRGWFPSNYVNAELVSLTEEEEPAEFRLQSRRGHRYSHSQSSTTSWTTISSNNHSAGRRNRSLSLSRPPEDDADPYCPPLMIPLLHGLSLLQNAVRSNRLAHFQPSTACIISCVRSILASTGTLQREAPVLQNFTTLSDERRRILTVLAALVAQAKRASEGNLEGDAQEIEVENMLRLGGQVFSHVRAFLAVAVECGVELPQDQDAPATATIPSATAQGVVSNDQDDMSDSPTKTPTQYRGRGTQPVPRPGLRIGGPRSRERPADSDSPSLAKTLARARQEQYMLGERTPGKHKNGASISSISSSSSVSSQQSVLSSPPPFPCGPSSAAQVMEALRYTHDHYLSTIAAFIGHVHTHSRSSHASSTGVLYDLVKEIVEMVCKLLTIVEAVMQYPDVPANRLGNLKQAKEGLYDVTSSLAESVRLLTVSLPSSMSEEAEKQVLLRSATGAVQAGADCVAAVKVCLTRAMGDKPFVVNLPTVDRVMTRPLTPAVSGTPEHEPVGLDRYRFSGTDEEDDTIQPPTSSPTLRSRQISSGSDNSSISKSSFSQSDETRATSPDTVKSIPLSIVTSHAPTELDLSSPTSFIHTEDDGTSSRGHQTIRGLEESIVHGEVPLPPLAPIPEYIQDPTAWMFGHDYNLEDITYNSEGHLVGATMDVLVEKMTPHDSIVDPAFSAVFFLTFRLFSSPLALVDSIISRYNLMPPQGISNEDLHLWQQKKGIPVRLRVSNFIKMWVELYWRPGVDDVALGPLTNFTREGLAIFFQGPAHRILDLLNMRRKSSDLTISPQLGERARDPGMSINPPTATTPTGEIPRPLMTKTLLTALRKKDFSSISVTEFDPLELSRQMTITECHLYCQIQPEEILETGQEGATPPVNIKAVTSFSTVITGWVAESILDEPDLKKRTALVKFFIKVADRCAGLNNFSTSRSVLAALDSSVISRLRQTWAALPQKNKLLLESLRKLADHGRNYHEYRSKLRNTAPPAVPFLGLYLTDVTFCREGNPSLRASPLNTNKKLINFNKYHKLARIVQDMQRFQVPYTLKAIPEAQEYLHAAFEKCKHHGDLQDLYRRSLLVEPKQPADAPPAMANDMRQLFSWATRSTQAS